MRAALRDLLAGRRGEPLAWLARRVERRLACRIHIRRCDAAPILGSGDATTYSRPLQQRVAWPRRQTWTVWEHWIFFDSSLPADARALCVARQIGHIVLRLGRRPQRGVHAGRFTLSRRDQREAERFARLALRFARHARRSPGGGAWAQSRRGRGQERPRSPAIPSDAGVGPRQPVS